MAERARGGAWLALAVGVAACGGGASPVTAADPDAGQEGAAVADAGAFGEAAARDANATLDGAARADEAGNDAAATDLGPYDADGPLAFTVETASLTSGGRTFTVNAYLPTAPGAHPIVSLSPGILQPAIAYAVYGRRLASHGIAALVRDDPGVAVKTTDVATDIAYTLTTWLPTALAGKVDPARIGLAGHSRGGKASLLAAEGPLHGKVSAWFGLDPVDSSAFGGGAPARDTIAQLGIPTAILGAEIASTCSPAADSYAVLFAAAAAPSVELVGKGAGHTQLEDAASCSACGICTPAGTADGKVVLAYALRYLTAFFARELLGDARVGAAFEGAGAASDVAAGRVRVERK